MKTSEGIVLRPIPLLDCRDYMAGSDGRIYSRAQRSRYKRKSLESWIPLRGGRGTKGYTVISIWWNGRKLSKSAHRLVCSAFNGLPPKASMQVRHLDGNPANDMPQNLRWGTQAENWSDRKAHGRIGENRTYKLTPGKRASLRKKLADGISTVTELAHAFGISPAAVRHYRKGAGR